MALTKYRYTWDRCSIIPSTPPGTKGLPDVSEGSELSSPTPDDEENDGGGGYKALRMGSLIGEVHEWWGSQLELSSASDSDN